MATTERDIEAPADVKYGDLVVSDGARFAGAGAPAAGFVRAHDLR